jgi:CubicO group peptidase (beta-lactamase class C family)
LSAAKCAGGGREEGLAFLTRGRISFRLRRHSPGVATNMEETPMHRRSLLAAPLLAALVSFPLLAQPSSSQPLPTTRPEEVGLDPARLARIKAVLEAEVEANRIPGAVVMVARRGKLAYQVSVGQRDRAANAPMQADAIFRIYSMTKPMTSVAAMMLMEEGRLHLTDPVGRFLPEFRSQVVSVPVVDPAFARITYRMEPARTQATVQDLLRHTSGLAYGEITTNAPVRDAYQRANLFAPGPQSYDNRSLSPADFNKAIGAAPLAHQPGTVYEYSQSTDVLGRVVEAVSGQRLEVFLEERLFRPLRMADTAFHVPGDRTNRLAAHLGVDHAMGNARVDMIDVSQPPGNASGGAGAVSTAADYLRFSQMLLQGGVLDGVRILSPATVRLMTSDHLGTIPAPGFAGVMGTPGYTFGLGFAVRTSDGLAGVPGRQGQFMWAGYGGTYFWVDPAEQLAVVFMSAAPSVARTAHRRLVQTLVHSAIVE